MLFPSSLKTGLEGLFDPWNLVSPTAHQQARRSPSWARRWFVPWGQILCSPQSPVLHHFLQNLRASSNFLRHLTMSSELGRGSLCKAIALCSSVIALGVSENRVGMAERGLPRFFGGVGYWMKSMMLSLGDGRRILEIAAGIPAIVGSCIMLLLPQKTYVYVILFYRRYIPCDQTTWTVNYLAKWPQ